MSDLLDAAKYNEAQVKENTLAATRSFDLHNFGIDAAILKYFDDEEQGIHVDLSGFGSFPSLLAKRTRLYVISVTNNPYIASSMCDFSKAFNVKHRAHMDQEVKHAKGKPLKVEYPTQDKAGKSLAMLREELATEKQVSILCDEMRTHELLDIVLDGRKIDSSTLRFPKFPMHRLAETDERGPDALRGITIRTIDAIQRFVSLHTKEDGSFTVASDIFIEDDCNPENVRNATQIEHMNLGQYRLCWQVEKGLLLRQHDQKPIAAASQDAAGTFNAVCITRFTRTDEPTPDVVT